MKSGFLKNGCFTFWEEDVSAFVVVVPVVDAFCMMSTGGVAGRLVAGVSVDSEPLELRFLFSFSMTFGFIKFLRYLGILTINWARVKGVTWEIIGVDDFEMKNGLALGGNFGAELKLWCGGVGVCWLLACGGGGYRERSVNRVLALQNSKGRCENRDFFS